ncbi:MAG: Cyanophycinase [Chloroflexi bacterium ADurb.Bin360]|nr:MAG: Cyanophycinase [Chloroflexi bacterium ADurb.Bin360]
MHKTQYTLLFLLGGIPAYKVYADEFVSAAGGKHASIAVLAQTRAIWENRKAEITEPWIERGVSRFSPITPGENGMLDPQPALATLKAATGILICGGDTPTNQRLFASDPIGALIQERYRSGIPVAGISAGALTTLEVCQLPQSETGAAELQVVRGLGLASGFVIGVHFTEWNALPEVIAVMAKTKTAIGYGIDEPACLVCENGAVAHVLGKSVYRIVMTDFAAQSTQVQLF